MSIGVVDAVILLLIALGGIVGFKNGAIKEGTKFIGFLLVVILSFLLKDKLMVIMYENMPFFNFFGLIKGIDSINVLVYEVIAFLIIFLALTFILKVLIVLTGFVEWILKLTVFLQIPSKLLGIVVGCVEYYVYVFLILYILNMPVFNLTLINESSLGNYILDHTPILSNFVSDTIDVYQDVVDIAKNREDKTDKEINTMVLATLLDHKLITVENAEKLVESNKIIIEDDFNLENYQDEENILDILKEKYYG